MAYTKTTWIDKAVQYAQRYFMNWDGGNDKNLLPPFTDWTRHANAVATLPYTLTLTATAADQESGFILSVSPNQTFTFSFSSMTGRFAVNYYSDSLGATFISSDGYKTTSSFTFTTPANCNSIKVYVGSATSGTFTFTNPQLELGSSATAFAPKKMYTIKQSGGTVTQAGTPVNAGNLNKLEQGVQDAHTTADAALPKSGGTMTNPIFFGDSNRQIKQSTSGLDSLSLDSKIGYAFVSSKLGSYLTENAYFDGTNWQRYDTSQPSRSIALDNNFQYQYSAAGTGVIPWVPYTVWTTENIRTTNGYVEWNNGGTWLPMGDIQVGKPRTAVANASTNPAVYTTVLNITGVKGRIDYAYLNSGYASMAGWGIKVTIDGVVEEVLGSGGIPYYFLATDAEPIYFYSSLKVEVKGYNDPYTSQGIVQYRLLLGTP